MAIEGEIIPAVSEESRAALSACKAQYAAVVWTESAEGLGTLAANVLSALSRERKARFGEALSAFQMKRAN